MLNILMALQSLYSSQADCKLGLIHRLRRSFFGAFSPGKRRDSRWLLFAPKIEDRLLRQSEIGIRLGSHPGGVGVYWARF
jgi:hypothetical protein